MDQTPLPQTLDIVLVGGGHTHALVLRKWGMTPLAGARLTLINPGPTAPYSGMLPGHVAGHYERPELDIDLVRLARFAGARIILGHATGIDPKARVVHVPGRAPVAFDLVSVDVGITSDMPQLSGFADWAVPAKPLGPFAQAWADFLTKGGPAKVAMIGGGVAGVELALAMAHALQARGRPAEVSIIDHATALGALRPAAAQRIRAALAAAGVTLREHTAIAGVTAQGITLTDGSTLPADFITGAAGAKPYDWLAACGLTTVDGFLSVSPTLQTSDPDIFAVGDCAHMGFAPRPKAGVYAVRQAPVLFDNLRARAMGRALRDYRPQGDYLKLISLGGKSALGERLGRPFQGPLIWRWKDRIDQRFMQKFRDLPQMSVPSMPKDHAAGLPEALGDKPMCGGCGAKVGRTALTRHMTHRSDRQDIQHLPGDDAAVQKVGSAQVVLTTDHLRAMVDDPVVMTRIAVCHALGDVWAMGARPSSALASVILPRLSQELQARTLDEIMLTAREAMRAAGAEITGGHSSVGSELTLGFTVMGQIDGPPITLGGARVGDALILTKPIGSGVVMAAEMAGQASGADVAKALEWMQQPQAAAARILAQAHAMTDVTGFGLAGHLLGMCQASHLAARVDPGAVPLMQGAQALAAKGIRSTLFSENRSLAPELPTSADLFFDPQTGGGLLAAVAPEGVAEILDRLEQAGYCAAQIGEMTAGAPAITLV